MHGREKNTHIRLYEKGSRPIRQLNLEEVPKPVLAACHRASHNLVPRTSPLALGWGEGRSPRNAAEVCTPAPNPQPMTKHRWKSKLKRKQVQSPLRGKAF